MKILIRTAVLLGLLVLGHGTPGAQKVALKNNILYDAALTPNVGVEIRLAPRWTLDVTGQVNLWTVDGHKWKHWLAQPEARYWFCRSFTGHFVGLHVLGGEYNVGNINLGSNIFGINLEALRHKRYQGWAVGAGIAYGYAWPIARHWNIEAEIGVGYVYTRHDVYPCADCGTQIAKDKHYNYVGPTKAALNIVYLF